MQGSSPPYVIVFSSKDSDPSSSNSSCLLQQPESSSNFFISLKSLLHRPLSRSRSPSRSRSNNSSTSDLCNNEDTTQTRRTQSRSRVLPKLRHKHDRAETPKIQDYLTLEQLEAIWRQQDTFLEPLDRDREPDQLEHLSDSRRGRQPGLRPPTETHPALWPQHQSPHAQINRYRGWDRIPVSPV